MENVLRKKALGKTMLLELQYRALKFRQYMGTTRCDVQCKYNRAVYTCIYTPFVMKIIIYSVDNRTEFI